MMKNSTLLKLFGFTIISFSLFTACSQEGAEETIKTDNVLEIDPANMDKSIKPGDDFFLYSNGGWMKTNPIPEEETRWGAFAILMNNNFDKIRTLFEEAQNAKDVEYGSAFQKIGDFYSSGMNSDAREKEGTTALNPYFEMIDGIKSIDDFKNLVPQFQEMGLYPFFYLFPGQDEKNSDMVIAQIYQGGLNLPDRDFYLIQDERNQKIREEYTKHITNMFVLLGDDKAKAEKASKTIMDIETKLAEISMTRLDLRNPQKTYNKVDIPQLKKISSTVNWDEYFATIGLGTNLEINVTTLPFFEKLDEVVTKIKIDDLKTYLRWNLLHNFASYLNDAFVNENFAFYGTVLRGQEKLRPRWKRVLNTTSAALGELVGEKYVERYFPAEAKTRMVKLVDNLRIALGQHINKLEWMSQETKTKAMEKLNRMNVKIGYPDKWIDYANLTVVPESYIKNIIASNKFDFHHSLSKMMKPVDRDEWHMTPQTVNAYYHPTMNEIVFPAAILQAPFFWMDGDDAVNYGAIGAVIGHEMTHGFDDQGRQYDVDGNLKDWWLEADAQNFDSKTKVLVEQYNKFEALDGMFVDGNLTLGENIADHGGVSVSLTALKNVLGDKLTSTEIEGFSPLQRFFLSYAQVWRMNIRDEELAQRLKTDVHSPGMYRVNGVLTNIPEFYQAFDVKEGDKLYKEEDKRAKVW